MKTVNDRKDYATKEIINFLQFVNGKHENQTNKKKSLLQKITKYIFLIYFAVVATFRYFY